MVVEDNNISLSEFYSIIDEIVKRIHHELKLKEDPWVDTEEAMRILKIKSKTTLQELRDRREIGFSQPRRKHIVYNRESLLKYLEKHHIKSQHDE